MTMRFERVRQWWEGGPRYACYRRCWYEDALKYMKNKNNHECTSYVVPPILVRKLHFFFFFSHGRWISYIPSFPLGGALKSYLRAAMPYTQTHIRITGAVVFAGLLSTNRYRRVFNSTRTRAIITKTRSCAHRPGGDGKHSLRIHCARRHNIYPNRDLGNRVHSRCRLISISVTRAFVLAHRACPPEWWYRRPPADRSAAESFRSDSSTYYYYNN